MRVGSLFSGIGGFDLAAQWVGWETAWYSEIEPYACGVMARHFPDAINHGDITQIRGADVAPVDLLCGGFPCQDISLAGKGAGIGGARSGLWGEFARLIGEIHPRWVVAENVSALRSRGLVTVLQDLDALGYNAEWHCIPASAVGAPHQRDRIWIVAYPKGNGWGEERPYAGGGREGSRTERDRWSRPPLGGPHDPRRPEDRIPLGGDPVEAVRQGWHGPLDGGNPRASLPDGLRDRLEGVVETGPTPGPTHRPSDGRDPRWWALEPDVGGMVARFPARLDGPVIHAQVEKEGPREIVRSLWRSDAAKEVLFRSAGGSLGISETAALLPGLREPAGDENARWVALEGTPEAWNRVFRVWSARAASCPPYRYGRHERRTVEHRDALRVVPCEAPLEDGSFVEVSDLSVGRVTAGTLDRAISVSRLSGLGNAIVPQVAYRIFSAIALADASLTPPHP